MVQILCIRAKTVLRSKKQNSEIVRPIVQIHFEMKTFVFL